MGKLKEILDGWGNRIKDEFGMLDPYVKSMAAARLESCNDCDMRSGNKCDPSKTGIHVETKKQVSGCGCNIAAKTLSPTSSCPKGLW